jgi:hypothetical protein
MTDTQLRLRIDPPFQPLAQGSAHYVAALQTKPGELDALHQMAADTWSKFTPLIQIVGPKSPREQINADNITAWTGKIRDAVGTHPLFLDILRLRASHPVVTGAGVQFPVLARIYASARKRSLNFVPVLRVGETNTAHADMVADAAESDGRGLALRLSIRTTASQTRMSLTDYLSKVLVQLRADVNTTDLLLDLAFIEPDTEIEAEDLGPEISKALDVGDWRNVVLLGTSMPSMLSCVPEGTVGEIDRREWKVWDELSKIGLKRVPAFGDYAIQHPTPPQDGGGGSPRANVRYTTARSTVVARGRGPWTQEGVEQYVGLCQQLVARHEFSGAEYSWGDGVIDGCARGDLEPSSQRMWRGAGTSHHIRFVTDQMALSRPA